VTHSAFHDPLRKRVVPFAISKEFIVPEIFVGAVIEINVRLLDILSTER